MHEPWKEEHQWQFDPFHMRGLTPPVVVNGSAPYQAFIYSACSSLIWIG